jgi:two-component system sensor histidine kinase VicK
VDGILRNAIRLQRLINNILDVTAIEGQSFKVNVEQFDLNSVISSLIDDYIDQIKKLHSTVELIYLNKDGINNDLILVECDKERITQVISNLIDNAIKVTKKGIITITCEIDAKDEFDKKVIISVSDTGSGINSKMFPKFGTNSFQGTGLGLFICKNIVENHGGRIWAKNNDDDKRGTTIIFSLPLLTNTSTNTSDNKDKWGKNG